MNLLHGLVHHESLVAQWLQHPTIVPRSQHDDYIVSRFFTELKIYHYSLFVKHYTIVVQIEIALLTIFSILESGIT